MEKQFKKNVKKVNTYLKKYTTSIENDIQTLTCLIVQLIEFKVVTLRKLTKLQAYIRNLSQLKTLIEEEHDYPVYSIKSTTEHGVKSNSCDSLEHLPSLVDYECTTSTSYSSTTVAEREVPLENVRSETIVATCDLSYKIPSDTSSSETNVDIDLTKYIYIETIAEDNEDSAETNNAINITEVIDKETKTIGDYEDHAEKNLESQNNSVSISVEVLESTINKLNTDCEPGDCGVYLGRSAYESVMDVLKSVMNSYKSHNNFLNNSLVIDIEKSHTEPDIGKHEKWDVSERQIVSEIACNKNVNAKTKENKRLLNNKH